jgi:hypothetical protein
MLVMPGSPSPEGRKPGICQTGQLVTRKGPEGSNPSPGAHLWESSICFKTDGCETKAKAVNVEPRRRHIKMLLLIARGIMKSRTVVPYLVDSLLDLSEFSALHPLLKPHHDKTLKPIVTILVLFERNKPSMKSRVQYQLLKINCRCKVIDYLVKDCYKTVLFWLIFAMIG